MLENPRDGGEAQHVVDDGRPAEQARDRRQRRLGAHLSALAFEAFEQRGLFAADIGAGAEPRLDVEGVGPSRARLRREARRPAPARSRARKRRRRADIRSGYRRSPSSRRPRAPAIAMPSIRRNGSPSISMRSAKVPLSPSSALQTTYFWSASAPATVRHLMPGRETCAAAPAQAGRHDLLDGGRRPEAQRALQALEARHGADSRRARAGRSRRNGQRRGAAGGRARECRRPVRAPWDARRRSRKPASNSERGVPGRDRPVADAALRRLDFNERLQPEERRASRCARSRASTPRARASRASACATASAPTDSAEESRRDEDARAHCPRLAPWRRRRSRRAGRDRAGRSARRRAARRATARNCRGNRRSRHAARAPGAGCRRSRRGRVSRCATRSSQPMAWQDSARQSFNTRPSTGVAAEIVDRS